MFGVYPKPRQMDAHTCARTDFSQWRAAEAASSIKALTTVLSAGKYWHQLPKNLSVGSLSPQARNKADETLHLAKLCHLIVKPYFTNDSHLWHYAAMTDMELLFKTALSWNQFLAQRLTAELCQGTMPASQGRQCIPPSSLHTRVAARAQSPNQSSKPFLLSTATQPGHPEIRSLQVSPVILLYRLK